ncbi:MAG: hypothetical protein ACI90V_003341 [Bacillariaceae sp.]|jgi:hypothetical protein
MEISGDCYFLSTIVAFVAAALFLSPRKLICVSKLLSKCSLSRRRRICRSIKSMRGPSVFYRVKPSLLENSKSINYNVFNIYRLYDRRSTHKIDTHYQRTTCCTKKKKRGAVQYKRVSEEVTRYKIQ